MQCPPNSDGVNVPTGCVCSAGFTGNVDFHALAEDLRSLKTLRDTIAHGVWTQNIKTGAITLTFESGNWTPSAKSGKVSRRIVPEARIATPEGLESVRDGIDATIRATERLLRSLEHQVASSPDRYPPQRPLQHRPDGPK